jgi:uncharacterized paraquat-inducible protein A
MSYVNCPRCRLTVRVRADALAPAHCPRCAHKHGVREPVFLSETPSRLFQVAPVASAIVQDASATPA